MIVAGFISTADLWIRFDQQWKERLAFDGISCFHAAEFNAFANEFKVGWRGNEQRQRKLLEDLIEIIRANTFRLIGSIIVNKDVNVLSRDQLKIWHVNAYSYAAGVCISRATDWQLREKIFTPVEFVFEDGDFGRGEMLKHSQQYFQFTPNLRPKKDTPNRAGIMRPGFIPLQAADFLAYEMFRACGKGSYPTYKPRWPMEQFERMLWKNVGIYDAPALSDYSDKMKVWEAMKDWPNKRT